MVAGRVENIRNQEVSGVPLNIEQRTNSNSWVSDNSFPLNSYFLIVQKTLTTLESLNFVTLVKYICKNSKLLHHGIHLLIQNNFEAIVLWVIVSILIKKLLGFSFFFQ